MLPNSSSSMCFAYLKVDCWRVDNKARMGRNLHDVYYQHNIIINITFLNITVIVNIGVLRHP